MTLAAAQVIDALAARLATVPATAGRVFTSRAWPLAEADLPAWRFTAEDEEVEAATVDGGLNQHSLSAVARGIVRATADLDDAMHTLAAAGLAALFAGSPPYSLQLTRITRRMQSEGEAAVGSIDLELRALYFVAQATPETIYS